MNHVLIGYIIGLWQVTIYVAPINPQFCQFSSSEFQDGGLDTPRDAQEQIKFLNHPVLYCRQKPVQ